MRHYTLTCLSMLSLWAGHVFAQSTPDKRAHHSLVYDEGTSTILMTAGSTPLNGGQSYKFYNDIWRIGKNGWTQSGVAGDERSGIGMVYHTKNKAIYSYGGFTGQMASGQLRVLENGQWRVISDFAEMKAAEAGFVYDVARNKLVAFGGSPGVRGQVNSVTWEWDGLSWKKFEGTQPPGRQAHLMVYDSKRNRTVLYGGMDGFGKQFEDGVWEFNGSEWVNIPQGALPGSRLSPGAAFDSKRGLVVLFGGDSGQKTLGDTWVWDGKTWKQLSDTGPTPRTMGYMAYDKFRDRIVLFGGRPGWPNDANDTWEWDGTKWSELKSR